MKSNHWNGMEPVLSQAYSAGVYGYFGSSLLVLENWLFHDTLYQLTVLFREVAVRVNCLSSAGQLHHHPVTINPHMVDSLGRRGGV